MENVLALAAASAVMVMIPGPVVALVVATSLRFGAAFGLAAVLGTTLGNAIQVALVVAGLSALLAATAGVLFWIKWIGAAYLIFLAIKTWREPAEDLSVGEAYEGKLAAMFWRGVGIAMFNPKTIMFNAAFIPQFVDPSRAAGPQLFLLAAVFVLVSWVGDSAWAVFAAWARGFLIRFGRLRNKLTGGFLFTAGVGLALSRPSQ